MKEIKDNMKHPYRACTVTKLDLGFVWALLYVSRIACVNSSTLQLFSEKVYKLQYVFVEVIFKMKQTFLI